MGYDISHSGTDFDIGYTYNGSKMWYDIFGEDGIKTLAGMNGKQAEEAIVQFLIDITRKYMRQENGKCTGTGGMSALLREVSVYRSHPENIKHAADKGKTLKAKVREYDPGNGWGSAFSQLNLMLTMLVLSRENPDETWQVF